MQIEVQEAATSETVRTRGGRRTTSLRTALAWLFAGLFLPLLLLGSSLLAREWSRQRDLAIARLSELAIDLRTGVEREVALDLAVVGTLASLPEFDRQDWAALYKSAKSAAKNRLDSWIVVADRRERLLNTRFPFEPPRPIQAAPPKEAEWKGRMIPFYPLSLVEEPLRTAKPAFSGLIYGSSIKGPVVTITVPVVRDDTPRYVLSLAYSPEIFARLLRSQPAADELIRVIFDRTGLVVARSSDHEAFVGRRVGPPLDQEIGALQAGGIGEGVTPDGTPVIYAYSRSEVNGWTVVVATPRDAVFGPARQALWTWLAILLATGVIGAAAAFRLWQRLALPLANLAEQARSPEALPAEVAAQGVEEIEVLRRAMADAANDRRVRQLAEQELEQTEARLRVIVESSPMGILMVDARGTITLVNRRVEELFGYARAELLGQPVDLLVPRAPQAAHGAHVSRYFAAPTARTMGVAGQDLYGRRKDESEFPIEIGLSPIEIGEARFALASIVDISDRKRVQDELRRSNQDLEQFAYVASHDLQEPLRMVASFTELLGQRYRGKLDEKADKYIHYAVDGAKRMQGLITDLLAFSRVGSRAKPLSPVAASSVVWSVLRTLRLSITEAAAQVDVDELPLVLADEGQLAQVFQNLIGNAIKFRGEKSPHIVIGARRSAGMWQFFVKDNGIGFEPQYAERIFLIFQRLHDRGRFEGSGIGLSIVKRIVERHGGHVWAESQPGEGATFRFTLRPAPAAAAGQEAS